MLRDKKYQDIQSLQVQVDYKQGWLIDVWTMEVKDTI